MKSWRHRATSLLALFAIVAVVAAPCEGWMASKEARLSCCAMDGDCPMDAASPGGAPSTGVTQAQADACCGSAEGARPNAQAAASFVSPPALAAFNLGSGAPALVAPRAIRLESIDATTSSPPVPLHLLLSVFLV